MNDNNYDIIIIGGGPAGSTAALYFSGAGFNTCLVEKKKFPREVLCGEFLSGEVSEILKELDLFEKFLSLNPINISKFRYLLNNDRELSTRFNFPAYAMKRSLFDQFLLESAIGRGTKIFQPAEVTEIKRDNKKFLVSIKPNEYEDFKITAEYVISAYGKQNVLDKKLKRNFVVEGTNSKNSEISFNGIKYHLDKRFFKNFPDDEIRIYVDDNIYCGLNPVSDTEITLCFLEKRNNGDGSARNKIKNLLQNNESFGSLFEQGFEENLYKAPVYGTGNIYFGKKNAVEDGVFFIGDAAGMIAPFTGDGIGMAMYSAKILSFLITQNRIEDNGREHLEQKYIIEWKNSFLKRTKVALFVQQAILNKLYRHLSFKLIQTFPFLLPEIIKSTRNSIKNS